MTTGITGLILAGGRGTRMQGRDKGLIRLHGRPLVTHVAERLAPHVERVVVSCNRNREVYADLGYDTVVDRLSGSPGPLAGIDACFGHVHTPFVFCCPCDMPYVPVDVVPQLQRALDGSSDIAYVDDGERAQPLLCLLRTQAIGTIGPYLEQGGRSVMGWVEQQQGTVLRWAEPADADAFTNLNWPEDFAP